MRVKRNIFEKLEAEINRPEISILIGPRQVGKTHLLERLREKSELLGKKTFFYNLEKPTDLHEFAGDSKELYQKLSKYPESVIFIDEFHYLENASKLFKAIFDAKKNIKIFASGSSSIELHKHLKESLAGRVLKTEITPFSLDELKQIPGKNLEHYLRFGGLPGLVHEKNNEDQVRMIEMVVETYLVKDIKSLIKEENIRAYNQMLYYLAQNQGQLILSSNLAREISLSEPTVKKYLDILSQTFVIYQVSSYSGNLANELKKSSKYYLYDLGVRNMLLKDFSFSKDREDIGQMGETFVFYNLRRQLLPNMDIKFWRTKVQDEIDFIVIKNRIPYPIEVKTTLVKGKIPPAFIKFFDAYPKTKEGYIFAKNCKEDQLLYENKIIYLLPWEKSDDLGFMKDING